MDEGIQVRIVTRSEKRRQACVDYAGLYVVLSGYQPRIGITREIGIYLFLDIHTSNGFIKKIMVFILNLCSLFPNKTSCIIISVQTKYLNTYIGMSQHAIGRTNNKKVMNFYLTTQNKIMHYGLSVGRIPRNV